MTMINDYNWTWASGAINVTATGNTTYGNYGYWIQDEWLKEVSYKPGWAFRLMHNSTPTSGNLPLHPGPNLVIEAKVRDSKSWNETTLIHTLPFPETALLDRNAFFSAVMHCILMVERHETMEFFMVSGTRFRNPHPDRYTVLYD